jgi:1-acyl-sn-glycerol-3-phosphate acyltransferase
VRPPPRWVRRVVIAPIVLGLALGLICTSPIWVLVTLIASPFTHGRLRPLRVIWVVTVYLCIEAVALTAMFLMWVASGFGWRIRRPRFQRAHYRLCGALLRVLYRAVCWALRVTVTIEGAHPGSLPSPQPLLVLCRHAGPGDSFLLAHALINWYAREPRIVLKDTLQWDPTIDVLLHRLPSRFIAPGGGEEAERQIAELASDLDGDDALVIFPEGGNFTPERWERAIARLRKMGLNKMAARAARMRNVLPPRPGGVLAAVAASPRAAVVFVGHTGVDHLITVADVWRELPMDKTLTMHWWLEPAANVPADPEGRIEWLYAWWARIDAWIAENRTEPLPRPRIALRR